MAPTCILEVVHLATVPEVGITTIGPSGPAGIKFNWWGVRLMIFMISPPLRYPTKVFGGGDIVRLFGYSVFLKLPIKADI